MQPRLKKELDLLRRAYPGFEFQASGQWLRVPRYALPTGWNRTETDIVIQVPPGYPATPPYGIYVPAGLLCGGARPNNYQEPAGNQPPFPGSWGIFSWAPADGAWQVPNPETVGRANLLAYLRGIGQRFQEGL
jgi:hypothetical protein